MLTTPVLLNMDSSQVVIAQVTGTVTINDGSDYVNSTAVTLHLSCATAVEMQFSNDNTTWSDWEAYATTKAWNLTEEYVIQKTVYVNFNDASQIGTASATVFFDPVPPTPYVYLSVISAEDNEMMFDAGYSEDNLGIVSCFWDFGDGTNGNGTIVTHAFTAEGKFTGTLTVTDVAGNTATTSFWVKIPLTVSSTPTPTPTAIPTPTPEIRTPQPTIAPTTQPTPNVAGSALSTTVLVIILVVAAIIIVGIVIVVMISRSKPKPTTTI